MKTEKWYYVQNDTHKISYIAIILLTFKTLILAELFAKAAKLTSYNKMSSKKVEESCECIEICTEKYRKNIWKRVVFKSVQYISIKDTQ